MAAVSHDRTGVASGINNAVARVASLLAIAVLGIVFVWSHDAALSARLDRLDLSPGVRQSLRTLEPGANANAQVAADVAGPVATAEAEAIDRALAAVALVCAACALAGAACAAVTIKRTHR